MKDCQDFLFLYSGESKDWFIQYRDLLGVEILRDRCGRWPTMKMALSLFLQRGGGTILETGCQREPEDWGAGASTTLFEKVLSTYDAGHLVSVDNNMEHLKRADSFIEGSPYVSLYHSDSVEFLNRWDKPIDLLYLDSFDYPVDEISKPYGGMQDWPGIVLELEALTEAEMLRRHGDLLAPSQAHCLRELIAAEPHLHDKSIVLIDDNTLPGGGKGRLAREHLLSRGWTILFDYHQSLWIK